MTSQPWDDDSEALFACAATGAALCTVTAIDGSWSRRLGAQLAVLSDGSTRGSLADGCLEKALATEALAGQSSVSESGAAPARVLRYGEGSPFLDIRLPCGSGIEVMVDPTPDRQALEAACAALVARQPAELLIGMTPQGAFVRRYLPKLRLVVMGSGPEVTALVRLAQAQQINCVVAGPLGEPTTDIAIGLGQAPELPPDLAIDPWTAIAVLFHDHEWERGILPWALASPAFYVGAQGGRGARETRLAMLAEVGGNPADPRLHSPIGVFAHARTPSVLALSVLAEIVAEHEQLLG